MGGDPSLLVEAREAGLARTVLGELPSGGSVDTIAVLDPSRASAPWGVQMGPSYPTLPSTRSGNVPPSRSRPAAPAQRPVPATTVARST